ncbi:Omp28-related outer membrane protein [Kaistella flava (ex Peng et al. 2021)]|uniref:Omp28-related outer membrane protein n=1 Tax=Kaistella flava (ex Peng et al. 2021) TaxID=2038776 RepID=A0A7M2Y6K0_9FLAO|nr:Omp28-related outer membrane protein [Kaistella flava (ex Peng et al. 2021)]QOW08983.1 Omp28-related outer membrane protein [Kaistella flava (ex Peng et al. 2021)]
MKKTLLLLTMFVLFLNSCAGSESDEGMNIVTYVKLSSSESAVLLGNSIKLIATDNLNNDVTGQSTFYINGELNSDHNIFVPTHIGEYTITAKYQSITTKPLTINSISLTGVNFVHRILFEDFTGTWCGNCPIASARFDKLIEQNNKAVFVGLHGPTVQTDPFTNEASTAFINQLGIWAYPTILINHIAEWSTSNNNYTDVSFPLQYIQPYSKVGIAINTKLESNVISGDFSIAFAADYSNLKTLIYVVEDQIKYPQHNYFNGSGGKPLLYGGLPIVPDYVNHNVLRALLTPVTGEAIPANNSQNNNTYLKNFSYNIPSNFVKENMKIIVAVLNSQNEVINVREAKVNTTNALETL